VTEGKKTALKKKEEMIHNHGEDWMKEAVSKAGLLKAHGLTFLIRQRKGSLSEGRKKRPQGLTVGERERGGGKEFKIENHKRKG